MKELIDELERLTTPNFAVDGKIKLAHAGYLIAAGTEKAEVIRATNGDLCADPLPYTGSYDAALRLLPDGWEWSIDGGPNTMPGAHLTRGGEYHDDEEINVLAATPIIAFCIACLKALAASHTSPVSEAK